MTEFTYQVNKVDNNLYFIGEVNIESVDQLTQQLYKLETNKNNTSANLYITSNGGSCTDGLSAYDILQTTTLKLTVYIKGFVGSAATLFAFTKHKTVMYKNSVLAFHELFNSHSHRYSNAKASFDYSTILMQQYLAIYNIKTNLISKEWLVVDKYLTADKALDMKIVDEVI